MAAFQGQNESTMIYLDRAPIQAVYKGTVLVWEAVSKIWKGNQVWKNNEVWKY